MEKTVRLGCLHMRQLQWYLKTHCRYPQSLDIPLPVSQVLRNHLQWWTNLSNLRRGSPLHQKEHNLLLFPKRLGCSLKASYSQWSVESGGVKASHKHFSFKIIRKSSSNQNLLISTDYSSLVAYLNKQEGTHSQEMCALIWRIMAWANARGIQILAKFQGISMF